MPISRRPLVRRALVVVALPAVLAVACLPLWPDQPGHASRANFDRIQNGMTFEDVVSILGPPGLDLRPSGAPSGNTEDPLYCGWGGDTGEGYVLFDCTGAVCGKGYSRKPLVVTLRRWWSWAFGRRAPF